MAAKGPSWSFQGLWLLIVVPWVPGAKSGRRWLCWTFLGLLWGQAVSVCGAKGSLTRGPRPGELPCVLALWELISCDLHTTSAPSWSLWACCPVCGWDTVSVVLHSAPWVPCRLAAGDIVKDCPTFTSMPDWGKDTIREDAGELPAAADPVGGCQPCELGCSADCPLWKNLLSPSTSRALQTLLSFRCRNLSGARTFTWITSFRTSMWLQQPGVGAPGRGGAPGLPGAAPGGGNPPLGREFRAGVCQLQRAPSCQCTVMMVRISLRVTCLTPGTQDSAAAAGGRRGRGKEPRPAPAEVWKGIKTQHRYWICRHLFWGRVMRKSSDGSGTCGNTDRPGGLGPLLLPTGLDLSPFSSHASTQSCCGSHLEMKQGVKDSNTR